MAIAEVGEYRVLYEEHGSGDAVLLVNGLGADHRAWALQTDALKEHHRVVVFDNPGIGGTTGPAGPYTSEVFADVGAGLLRYLGIEHAHVVGASMGGIIAQQLALRHSDLVRSLSLHCTWPTADNYLTALIRSWQSYSRVVSRLELCRQIWLFVFTVSWFNDRRDELAELEQEVLETPDLQSSEQFSHQADACIAHDVLDQLPGITAPTYISVGDRDLLTPAHHTYRIKERMAHARLRIWKEMGHAPFWEIPDEFNTRQLEFLEAH